MPAPRRDIVQPLIDRYRGPIVGAVLGAWDDWLASPCRAVWRCRRSRANFVWEQIIDRAHAAFDTSPDVRILDANETFRFLVEDLVLFRFKKGDDVGLSNNVPTQLSLAFHDHSQNLLGLPEVHRVDVVYQLNRLETEIRDLLVVGRDEDLVLWSYSLLLAGTVVAPLPAPTLRPEPQMRPARRLVRPRGPSENRDRSTRD